ncbi:MAG: hypothetical protein M0Z30_13550 [Actinomycetota bacterium]|nr:hypothetical protein [Actinomycetota bacterium]
MPTTQRALYAYSIHGRGRSGEVIDYVAFVQALVAAPSSLRRATISQDEVVLLRDVRQRGHVWELRFLSGSDQESLTLFDVGNDRERDDPRSAGEIVVRPTFLYLNPESRFVALERRRPGLSPGEIGKALGIIGTAIGFDDDLVIDLNPVTAESFNVELEQFDRIRQASVTVARPNYDWTENANTLTTYAAESDGQTAELEISAPRGGSLAKEQGIVQDIKELVQRAIGPLKKVKIVGRHADETRERTLTLASHQERQFVPVDSNASAEDQRSQVAQGATGLLGRLELAAGSVDPPEPVSLDPDA